MPYNPALHHRHSIRLKGYDYSQAGWYFITICVQNHVCLFGKIENGQMILNDAGKMVEKWYLELGNKYSDIELGEYVVMPNHFHAIVINTGNGCVVGADLCVCPCPDEPISGKPVSGEHISGEHVSGKHVSGEHVSGEHVLGEHTGSPLHAVVQWFKTMSTNEYIRGVKTLNWQPFNKKLWQRNYYEHIIRNEQSHQNISDYIVNNPANWENDRFYGES